MSQPHQRTRALLKTRYFLEQLTRPGDIARVSVYVRHAASELLLQYPTEVDIELIHEAMPGLFGPVKQRQPAGMPHSTFKERP